MLRRKRQVRGVLSKNFLHFITNHRIRRKVRWRGRASA
jgi:hypothetical protein